MSRTPATLIARAARALAAVARRGRGRRAAVFAPPGEAKPERRAPRRAARAVLASFLLATVLLNLFAVCALDVFWPRLRDPEYGRRADRLRARVAEHPDRPVVLVFGSSRVAMGVRPSAWEDTRPGSRHDPLLFNMATVGAGPPTLLLVARRAYTDGFRPSVVLIEYWPPVLRQDGVFADWSRYDVTRLRWGDRPHLREYHPAPHVATRAMRRDRLNVLSTNRTRLLVQLDPELLVKPWRYEGGWLDLDAWGWLPGMDPHPDDADTRRKLTDHQRPHFAGQLAGCSIHADSDRALRDLVALARANGARIGFLYLPESAEFQARYPAELERAARDHLAGLSRDLAVPVVDARNWMDERYLADGFHLSRTGAAAFTARLGPVVAATFPPTGGEP